MIHGGAWIKGDKAEDRDLAEHFVRAGYAALAVNYRLAEGRIQPLPPPQLDDVQKAVRWARKHAAEYGIDPGRIAAFGHSAGGHLAALLATTDTRDDSDPALAGISSRVNCAVDCAGPSDFTDAAAPAIGPEIRLGRAPTCSARPGAKRPRPTTKPRPWPTSTPGRARP